MIKERHEKHASEDKPNLYGPTHEHSPLAELYSQKPHETRIETENKNINNDMRTCLVTVHYVYQRLNGRPSEINANKLTKALKIGGERLILAQSDPPPHLETNLNLVRFMLERIEEKSSTMANKTLHVETTNQLKILEVMTKKEESLPSDTVFYQSYKKTLILLDKAKERHYNSKSKKGTLTPEEQEELRQTIFDLASSGQVVYGQDIFTFLSVLRSRLNQFFELDTNLGIGPRKPDTPLSRIFAELQTIGNEQEKEIQEKRLEQIRKEFRERAKLEDEKNKGKHW